MENVKKKWKAFLFSIEMHSISLHVRHKNNFGSYYSYNFMLFLFEIDTNHIDCMKKNN